MTQQQHVQIARKLQLRKRLLASLKQPGDAYVPFIGDGDIAVALYGDRDVWGVDNDGPRLLTANHRLSERLPLTHRTDARSPSQPAERYHSLVVGDADVWQFGPGDHGHEWSGLHGFAVADFDAYSYPYDSFRAFWTEAPKAPRVALFFTDAQKINLFLRGAYRHPSGEQITIPQGSQDRRAAMAFYFQKIALAWLKEYIKPWRVTSVAFYNRSNMLYWGANVANVSG